MEIIDFEKFLSERMKVVPITNDEFDKVNDRFDIPKQMLAYSKDNIENGDVLVSVNKHCGKTKKDIEFWIFLSAEEILKRKNEFADLVKRKQINNKIYKSIMSYAEKEQSVLIAKGNYEYGFFCRSIEDKDMKMEKSIYVSKQKEFYKLLKFYGTLINGKFQYIYDIIKFMDFDFYDKYI